jgi:drug/metabolite transporter (DMT)-like permease
MEPANHAIGILLAMVTMVSWAGASFTIKPALRYVAVPKATATMTILNASFVSLTTLLFVPLAAFRPERLETWVFVFLAGALHFGISRVFMNAAIHRIGPNRTIPVANSFPLVTAFFATLALGEPLTARILLGLALLLIGMTLIVRARPATNEPTHVTTTSRSISGWVLAGFTSLLMGVSAVFFKNACLDLPPLVVSTLALWIGTGIAWVIVGASKKHAPQGAVPFRAWWWVIASALCQSMAVPFYNTALTYTFAVHVTALASAQPLIALPMGWIFMREAENITPQLIGGVVLAVGGTLLVII